MKLSDLKRLPVGTKLRLVNCLMGPCDKAGTVVKVQSNAIAFSQDDRPGENRVSWLYFPKASDFRDDLDGFTILEDGAIAAQYKFA